MTKTDNAHRSEMALEKFLQNFLVEKNIAIHLMEDVELKLEGKHIYEILSRTKRK